MHKIIIAGYRGIKGHPIVFNGNLMAELLSISEEKHGLKELVEKYKYDTLVVETNYPGVVLDLDTIIDLIRIKTIVLKQSHVYRSSCLTIFIVISLFSISMRTSGAP